jgi:hypothetical protein
LDIIFIIFVVASFVVFFSSDLLGSCMFYSDFLWISHSYGLGAAVISNDPERCDRVAKVRLELTINHVQITHQNLFRGIIYFLR